MLIRNFIFGTGKYPKYLPKHKCTSNYLSEFPLIYQNVLCKYPEKVNEVLINNDNLDVRLEEMRGLDKSGKYHVPYQFKTKPKQAIKNLLMSKSNNLLEGGYEFASGGCSTLLMGSKGIGKSSTLRSSCMALSTMNANLSPIYIQYSYSKDIITPGNAILNNLISRGIFTDDSPKNMRVITEILYQNNLRVLLIIDELDQLYENKDDNELALEVLSELSFLASDPSGRYYVICCGSSSVMPLLITRDGLDYPEIVNKYPLIKASPDLNDTKFPIYRLDIGIMSNKEMKTILSNMLDMPPENIKFNTINFFRLFAGPNLRTMYQLCKSINRQDELEIKTQLYSTTRKRTINPRSKLNGLINETIAALIKKNNILLRNIGKITDADKLSNLLATTDWSQLLPLNREELKKIILTVKEKNKNIHMTDYLHLIDSGWFISDESLFSLYPHTPFQLVDKILSPNSSEVKAVIKGFSNSIIENLKLGKIPVISRE